MTCRTITRADGRAQRARRLHVVELAHLAAPARAPDARSPPTRSRPAPARRCVRLGPSTATSAIASRMPGNASSTSIIRPSASSTHPPAYPATAPTIVPTVAEIDTTASPTISEIRAPMSRRARMSRPSSSRPNGCCQDGPSSRCGRFCAAGSYGTSHGPATAAIAVKATIANPMRRVTGTESSGRATRKRDRRAGSSRRTSPQ